MNTKEFKDYVLECLELLNNIRTKPMMGGYLFYYNEIYFGGIYENNNFLIKKTKSNEKYNLEEEIPYKGAKAMYLIDDIENKELIKEIIEATCADLKPKK